MTTLGAMSVEMPTPVAIAFRRTYPVDRSLLFDSWTQVGHVRRWWDPRGLLLAACQIDLRVGGRFRFTNQAMGGIAHVFEGTYIEVLRPSRLVFETTRPASMGTLSFEQVGVSETELRMTIECASPEQRDALLQMGFVGGTTCTLQNLADHLHS